MIHGILCQGTLGNGRKTAVLVEGIVPSRTARDAFARVREALASPVPAIAALVLLQAHAVTAPWSLFALVALALPCAWRGDGASRSRIGAIETGAFAIAGAFIVAALASGALSRALPVAVPLAGFVVVVLLAAQARAGDAARIVDLLAIVATVQLVQALAALGGAGTPATALQQASVPWLVVPNDLAWMACLWPWWIARARARSGIARHALVALLLLQLATFVLFGSRLALAVAAIATLASLLPMRFTARRALVGAGVIAFAGAAMLALGKGLASLGARVDLWRAAWSLFREHPLLGVGPQGFVQHYAAWLPAAPVDPRLTPWPHSLPLEVLAEWGALGALAVAFAVFACWRAARSRNNPAFALAPVALAFTLAACVEASALRLWLWALAALLLAWPRIDIEHRTGDAPQ